MTSFIKWAGGKQSLYSSIKKYLPYEITHYYEPFVGGGGMLFNIISDYKPEVIVINDINKRLINCYKEIRDNPIDVISNLNDIMRDYNKFSYDEKASMYYQLRDVFNAEKTATGAITTAIFIFLNTTGFNGLYRENSNGSFNVPFYKNDKEITYDTDRILKCSELLQNVFISNNSYNTYFPDSRFFVYADPPYLAVRKNQFTGYSAVDFGVDEQEILCKYLNHISNCKILMSNSYDNDCEINQGYLQTLYKDWYKFVIDAPRAINRTTTKEWLFSNYVKKGLN